MKTLLIIIMIISSFFDLSNEPRQEYPQAPANVMYLTSYPATWVCVERMEEDDCDRFMVYRIENRSLSDLGYGFITTDGDIFIGAEIVNSEVEKEILLHEIGHWYTNRDPSDHSIQKEMLADEWAVAHGADPKKLIWFLRNYGRYGKLQSIIRIINLMGMEAKESPVRIFGAISSD